MSDAANETGTSTTTDGNQATSGATSTAGDESKPITLTSKQLAERLARAVPSDYDDLKSKAAEFDKLDEANKSEIERATDRVTKAEAEVATIPAKVADALRAHLIVLHAIEKDDADLFLTANDPELLLKQVARLTGRTAEQTEAAKKQGNRVSAEGTNSKASGSSSDVREYVNELWSSAD